MPQTQYQFLDIGGGLVTAAANVNTGNWRVQSIDVVNDSDDDLYVFVKLDGALVWDHTFVAQATESINTSPFQLGWDDANGGIIWDGYEVHTRWPAT